MSKSHCESILKLLINNERHSDCCFIVGSEKNKIYVLKSLLAASSPVFDSMFEYDSKADLSQKPIEVPDVSYHGFMNMIKFIYGFKIEELDPSTFIDTYIVADKYLFKRLVDDLTMHMAKRIDVENCLIIYDQILLSDKDAMSFDVCESMQNDVVNFITLNCRDALKSEWFTKIHKDTLIEILKMDHLHVTEYEIIAAIVKWINAELVRNGIELNEKNKLKEFESFKHLIRFTDLKSGMGDLNLMSELLSKEELCSLSNHLRDDSNYQLIIKYEGSRKQGNVFIPHQCNAARAVHINSTLREPLGSFDYISFYLKVDFPIYLQSIGTLLEDVFDYLTVIVRQNEDPSILRMEKIEGNGMLEFRFSQSQHCLKMIPATKYKLIFSFDRVLFGKGDQLYAFQSAYSKYKSHKQALCTTKENRMVNLTIIPDGQRYHCLSSLFFHF